MGVPSPVPAPTATGTATSAAPAIAIGQAVIAVEVALTPEEQANGLSRRDPLPPNTGMLFPFKSESTLTFWMKEMRFPLDIVWIGADCRVADISVNVPAPEAGMPDSALPIYQPKRPAQYVLEVNAGEATRQGITEGSAAVFHGEALASYACAERGATAKAF